MGKSHNKIIFTNAPQESYSPSFTKEPQIYAGEETASSTNGAEKTGCPHVED
jgi:hypothetical protein